MAAAASMPLTNMAEFVPAPFVFSGSPSLSRPVSIEMAAGMTVSSKLRGLLMQRELPENLWGAVAV